MAKEHSQSPDIDLDKTDRLPILDGTLFDQDVEDDAVPLDHTAVLAGPPPAARTSRGLRSALRHRSALAGGERALGGGAHFAAERRI